MLISKNIIEISDDAATIEDEDLIPQKDIVIVLTTNNYVKRMTTETFRTQHRGGRGVRGMSTNGEDSVNLMIHTHTHTDVLFFSNLGRVYRLRGYMIPEESRTSKGLPIQNLLNLEKGEKIVSILPLDDYHPEHFLFFATKEGVVKRTALSEFESIRKNGKIVAVNTYSNKRSGRKICYGGQDGSEAGKMAFKKILEEDFKLKERESWAEVSGAMEVTALKQGAMPIPAYIAELIMKDKKFDSIHKDGFHYTRKIGGEPHTKLMVGNFAGSEFKADNNLIDELINTAKELSKK